LVWKLEGVKRIDEIVVCSIYNVYWL